jgi:hypothetical protein
VDNIKIDLRGIGRDGVDWICKFQRDFRKHILFLFQQAYIVAEIPA